MRHLPHQKLKVPHVALPHLCTRWEHGNSFLCFALVPVKNTKKWTWFLKLLDRSIDGAEDLQLPYISDWQKGLKAAMRGVISNKVHAYCVHRLSGNAKTKFGKVVEQFFMFSIYTNSQRK